MGLPPNFLASQRWEHQTINGYSMFGSLARVQAGACACGILGRPRHGEEERFQLFANRFQEAIETAECADSKQINEHGQSLMFAVAGRPLNKGSAYFFGSSTPETWPGGGCLGQPAPDTTFCRCP